MPRSVHGRAGVGARCAVGEIKQLRLPRLSGPVRFMLRLSDRVIR